MSTNESAERIKIRRQLTDKFTNLTIESSMFAEADGIYLFSIINLLVTSELQRKNKRKLNFIPTSREH